MSDKEVKRRAIVDGNGNNQLLSIIESSDEPGKYGMLVVSSDGSSISNKERISNLGIDTLDDTYYYFGFTQVGTTNWRIKRMSKSNYSIDYATGTTAPATNWTDRTTLTYNTEL